MKASPLEIAWSAIAGVGMLLTAWMIFDAALDYRAVMRGVRGGYAKARGARWWIALGALVGNGMLVLVWAGFLVVGMVAMSSPPPPATAEQTAVAAIAGWALIAMEGLLAATQVWSRVVRVKSIGRPHLPPTGAQP